MHGDQSQALVLSKNREKGKAKGFLAPPFMGFSRQ